MKTIWKYRLAGRTNKNNISMKNFSLSFNHEESHQDVDQINLTHKLSNSFSWKSNDDDDFRIYHSFKKFDEDKDIINDIYQDQYISHKKNTSNSTPRVKKTINTSPSSKIKLRTYEKEVKV